MITIRQYQRLIYEHNQRSNMSRSAMKASVCRNTAKKYIKAGKSPAELKIHHHWRTRPDPFAVVWESTVVPMLKKEPELMAITILEWLEASNPGQFYPGQLRTLQRKIKHWRLLHGPEKEVYFPQVKEPGRQMEADWTSMNELEIRIAGEPYPHLLFHSVLAYSNWQWGMRCKSESYLSLQNGLQLFLGKLGSVPKELWVDNTTAATCRLGGEGKDRGFNQAFTSLCDHFQITPQVINVRCPNENGDVESIHGHLKSRIDQQLLLRGSRNFESLQAYDQFLEQMYERRNKPLAGKVDEERAQMRALPPTPLPDWREYDCRVSGYATIQLQKTTYSVPSRLIGTRLRARVWEDQIRLFHGRDEVATLERRTRKQGAQVNYRHVIEQLIRKPGAFEQYRWKEALFPTVSFDAAFNVMERQKGRSWAIREYLHILKLAADEGQDKVERALEELIQGHKNIINLDEVKALLGCWEDLRRQVQEQAPLVANLSAYDRMLGSEVDCEF